LFSQREFRALWLGNALSTAATSMAGLSLGLIVHAQTGSPLLTALVMFGPSVMQFVGAGTLMSLADTAPPRLLLTALCAFAATAFTAQAVFDLPPAGRLLIVLATAYVLSIASGARWGLVSEIAPTDQYALARSAMNVSVGAMQIVGFAVGGVFSALLGASAILWIAGSLAVIAGAVTWRGISSHSPRRTESPSFRATWSGNMLVLRRPSTRVLLVALCVPNGLIAGCEALFIPYARNAAPALFVASAIGMLVGDVLMGRVFRPQARATASTWLRMLLPAPFLVLLWQPPIAIAVVLVGAASIGYSASLHQQELLVRSTPRNLTGQVLGAESAARVTFQGLAAALAGMLAELMPAATAIAILSVGSLLVSLSLTPALRRAHYAPSN
jgi:MFS family permease